MLICRNWSNTKLLVDYCEQSNFYPVDKHELSTVEYTYHFNMNYFSSIDHFILSEQLYQQSVNTAPL